MRLTPTARRRPRHDPPHDRRGRAVRRHQSTSHPAVRSVAYGLATTGVVALVMLLAGAPAQAVPVAGLAVRVVALAGSVGAVLDNVRNWIMGVLAGLATVFLTIGGLRYVMAAGDPGEVAKAKLAFKSAGIGYGLAALAPLVVTVLKGIVGA